MKARIFSLVFLGFFGAALPAITVGHLSDNLPFPKGNEQVALRARALVSKLQGKKGGSVIEVERGKYAETKLEKSDRIFVMLVEFGDQIHPSFGGTAGPLHNQIEEPNRVEDNSTIWKADFNTAHYRDLYFKRMRDYYSHQSAGKYTFHGDIIEWVKVPYNEARYGASSDGVWYLIRDATNIFVESLLQKGWSLSQIHDYLATFDNWDRYDADQDGVFNEADGYIDHFQIVHAGEGEETGGGVQGTDAIWSHRWFAAYQGNGNWGPDGARFGGLEFGGTGEFAHLGGSNALGIWIGDYTVQPENGGLGVFAHEYGHDLGLPDAYDTAGGDNSAAFWTIMASGSYLGDGGLDGIGTRPADFNAWEKYQLGWLNYEVAFPGFGSEHELSRLKPGGNQKNGLFVMLPDKKVVSHVGSPFSGRQSYYSDSGNNLDNKMSRSVTLPEGNVSLVAQVNYEIELDYDYAYLTVNGTPVSTSLSSSTNPYDLNFGEGITGSTSGEWVKLEADLSPFAGQNIELGFSYRTDSGVAEKGFLVDDIHITGEVLDDAEGENPWTFEGFKRTDGEEVKHFFNAYIAELRKYRDYDLVLQTGPYNFGFSNTRPSWVEHFPYQDGLLISYWDTSYGDNNTSQHPGGGLILPIDAHPETLMRPDQKPWRSGVQSFDSTFSMDPTDALILHRNSTPSLIPSRPGVFKFDDLNQYWNVETPLAGVKNPQTGTQIEIKKEQATSNVMRVRVSRTH